MAHPTSTLSIFFPTLLFLSIISGYNLQPSLAQQSTTTSPGLGINYGQLGNDLPSPSRVATLLQSLAITRVKLYDYNPTILTAFANTNIEFTIGIPNNLVPSMVNPSTALTWVQTNVKPYISNTRITSITVGNEILTGTDQNLINSLVPAIKSVYSALKTLGLSSTITLSSPNSVGILSSSFPPSSGQFQSNLIPNIIKPLLDFHSQTNSPFLINAYPFFSYMADPATVSLDYVLFRPNATGYTDPKTNLHYDNMLYAQIDAVYVAIKALGYTNIPVQVSETGWPSKGDENEIGATPGNAAAYNGNLLEKVVKGGGTPGRPDLGIDVYVFALFNENQKPGPASERNYGLYYPDVEPVYDVGIQQLKQQSGKSGDSNGYLPQFYSSGMYYSGAAADARIRPQWRIQGMVRGDSIMSWMFTLLFITFLHFLLSSLTYL